MHASISECQFWHECEPWLKSISAKKIACLSFLHFHHIFFCKNQSHAGRGSRRIWH